MMKRVEGMDANTTRITGLDPGTEYNVQVSATTGAGEGMLSASVSVPVPTKEGVIWTSMCNLLPSGLTLSDPRGMATIQWFMCI